MVQNLQFQVIGSADSYSRIQDKLKRGDERHDAMSSLPVIMQPFSLYREVQTHTRTNTQTDTRTRRQRGHDGLQFLASHHTASLLVQGGMYTHTTLSYSISDVREGIRALSSLLVIIILSPCTGRYVFHTHTHTHDIVLLYVRGMGGHDGLEFLASHHAAFLLIQGHTHTHTQTHYHTWHCLTLYPRQGKAWRPWVPCRSSCSLSPCTGKSGCGAGRVCCWPTPTGRTLRSAGSPSVAWCSSQKQIIICIMPI